MPELPEVQTVVSELNTKLKGLTVKRVVVRAPKLVGVGPETLSPKRTTQESTVQEFVHILSGKKILSVTRRAKLLIFDIQGLWSMFVHLKMTGQFIFEDTAQRKRTGGKYRILNKKSAPFVSLPCPYTHVIFYFTNGSILYFNDVRKFGYLKLVKDVEVSAMKELREYGPEPLDKTFTFEVWKNAVKRRSKGIIKQVIMDNKIVVGIGNIYSDEILFHAKLKPARTISSLAEKDLLAIYKNIGPVLRKGIQARGSSVGDFIRTDGTWGTMGKFHYVYGRKGEMCKICNSTIESTKLGGRTASFCPKCQK